MSINTDKDAVSIAYLILCHKDPEHIKRLVQRLSKNADVYVHIDSKTDKTPFIVQQKNVFYIDNRLRISWGGFNSVAATILLIREAMEHREYDRLVILQGLDYPIKSDIEIQDFFISNRNTEFVRGCKITNSTDPYFYWRTRCIWFHDTNNPFKKAWNKINFLLKKHPICLRKDYIEEDKRYNIFWGSAQFAITGKLAKYILQFHDSHPKFNNYMKHSFPVDELYFTTIVLDSEFARNTVFHGSEPNQKGLIYYRNLHYFKYPPIIYNKNDYDLLQKQPELYCRKVTTEESSSLLDLLDKRNRHKAQTK